MTTRTPRRILVVDTTGVAVKVTLPLPALFRVKQAK